MARQTQVKQQAGATGTPPIDEPLVPGPDERTPTNGRTPPTTRPAQGSQTRQTDRGAKKRRLLKKWKTPPDIIP